MDKKITKREMYAVLTAAIPDDFAGTVQCGDNAVTVNADDVRAFITHELELLDRKSGDRKPTALQVENENLKNAIVAALLPDTLYTVSEIIKNVPECAGLNPQKVSPLMNAMCKEDDGRLIKTTEKRVSYFRLA